MKTKKLSLLLISILLFTFVIGFFSIEGVAGVNDLNFTFQNDNLFNITNTVYDDSFNVRNQTEYSGHYPATYSFENEIGFVDTEISCFNLVSGSEPFKNATVISYNDGHSAVVRLLASGYDGGVAGWFLTNQELMGVLDIELWLNGVLMYDNENFVIDRVATSVYRIVHSLFGGGGLNTLENLFLASLDCFNSNFAFSKSR